jgi:signal peptidase I
MVPKADGTSPPGGFSSGDLIIIKMCEPQDIKVGDIITFNPSPNDTENQMYLTHRVIEISKELGGKEGIFFTTQGDANNNPDPPFSGELLIGKKVGRIPGVGKLLQLLRENQILARVLIASFLGVIILLKWFFSESNQGTDENKQPKLRKTASSKKK